MGWRKWNRVIHRDAGYFFFGLFIIYAVSGIALNHREDWNPNYIITNRSFSSDLKISKNTISNAAVKELLLAIDEGDDFKKYYFPNPKTLKIFLEGGSVMFDIDNGEGSVEKIRKRPVFKEFNFLHYNNPKRFWTFYADLFSVFMILIAVSGLLIVRGKNGFARRGVWFVLIGLLAPFLVLILFS